MLDFDLAEMYHVGTKVLKQAVKRNIQRFPPDFMFELKPQEWENLRSQFVTSSWGGVRYMPYAFTEQGVAMLSGLLSSDVAIQVNIAIMRAFVAVRQLLLHTSAQRMPVQQQEFLAFKQYIEEVFTDQNDINEDTRMQLELINEILMALQAKNKELPKPRNPIGFKHN